METTITSKNDDDEKSRAIANAALILSAENETLRDKLAAITSRAAFDRYCADVLIHDAWTHSMSVKFMRDNYAGSTDGKINGDYYSVTVTLTNGKRVQLQRMDGGYSENWSPE